MNANIRNRIRTNCSVFTNGVIKDNCVVRMNRSRHKLPRSAVSLRDRNAAPRACSQPLSLLVKC